jgi:hypothetical protein
MSQLEFDSLAHFSGKNQIKSAEFRVPSAESAARSLTHYSALSTQD